MRNRIYLALGVLLFLIGGVWTLQGLGVLGGSAMSGDSTWAFVGPVVAAVGVYVGVWAVLRGRAGRR